MKKKTKLQEAGFFYGGLKHFQLLRLKGPWPRFVSESPSYPHPRGVFGPTAPSLDDVIWPAEDMNGKHVSLVSWFIWLISPGIHLICYILHKLPSSQLSSQHNKLASNEPLIPRAWRTNQSPRMRSDPPMRRRYYKSDMGIQYVMNVWPIAYTPTSFIDIYRYTLRLNISNHTYIQPSPPSHHTSQNPRTPLLTIQARNH